MKTVFIHIFFAVFLFYSGFIIPSEEREITIERLVALPEPNILVFETLRVKKYNRSTYVIDGTFIIKEDLDDSMDVEVIGYNLMSGQYKKLLDKTFKQYCKSIWDPALKDYYNTRCVPFTNVPVFGSCPWPKGTYWAKNMLIVDDNYIPKYLPGGEKWSLDVRFYQGDKIIAGYDAFVIFSIDIPIG